MSFLKAVFFTLPLMVIAAIGLAYFMSTQMIQPRLQDVLNKIDAMEASTQADSETLRQIDEKLDTLIARQ